MLGPLLRYNPFGALTTDVVQLYFELKGNDLSPKIALHALLDDTAQI